MALGIPSPQLNQQSLYRHSTGLPSILHQFAGHFPHAPLSLMYITPVYYTSSQIIFSHALLSLLVSRHLHRVSGRLRSPASAWTKRPAGGLFNICPLLKDWLVARG